MAVGSNRVKRGGSWNNNAGNCRVANRNNNSPDNRNNNIGFRLAHSSVTTDGCRFNEQATVPSAIAVKTNKNAVLVALPNNLHFNL